MAMNPMQRKARNSFLIGFLVSLIIMAVVVLVLLNRIKALNEAKEALEALQVMVYVAADDLKSGQSLSMDEDFIMDTVQTTMDTSQIISLDDFEFYDEDGNVVPKYNEDGSQKYKELILKVDVPAGTMVTKEMFYYVEEELSSTTRVQEYNMIVLPSQLKNEDYIDIRLTLPNGQDYVVLSKKKVVGTNATSIWLNVDEQEIQTLNSAIVDSYIIPGSKLYAVSYIEPGMQNEVVSTYQVSGAALDLMYNSPNIVEKARNELWLRYNATSRVQYFEELLLPYKETSNASVQSKNQEEVQKINAARQAYVESLQGTDDVGYTR